STDWKGAPPLAGHSRPELSESVMPSAFLRHDKPRNAGNLAEPSPSDRTGRHVLLQARTAFGAYVAPVQLSTGLLDISARLTNCDPERPTKKSREVSPMYKAARALTILMALCLSCAGCNVTAKNLTP